MKDTKNLADICADCINDACFLMQRVWAHNSQEHCPEVKACADFEEESETLKSPSAHRGRRKLSDI